MRFHFAIVFLTLLLSIVRSQYGEEYGYGGGYYGPEDYWCESGFWGVDGHKPCFPCTKCDIYFKQCYDYKDAVCFEGCENECQNGGHIGEGDMTCKCICPQDYYGEACEIHNPHTDIAEFELVDAASGIGKIGEQKCNTMCPFWDDNRFRQDGPRRCIRNRYWGPEFCLLCGAAGMDLIDQNTGKPIKEYCKTKTCEDGIIITDSHIDKSKEDGQTFGFHPECADRFFKANFGSKKWNGKAVNLYYDGYDNERLIWFWKEGKRSEECGKKACARLGRSLSKPGDFAVGHAIVKIFAGFDMDCGRIITVQNNYPYLYKKNGQYFTFDEECMDEFAGTKSWNKKIFTVSKGRSSGEQFKIKVFKNSRFFGGQSVGRVHPSSAVEKYFWKISDEIFVHKPCKGKFGKCSSLCLKSYEITQKPKNEGKDCPYESGYLKTCKSGEDACVNTCDCEEQKDPLHFVCGADGKSYRNECHAKCVGTTVEKYGPCECMEVEDGFDDYYDMWYGYGGGGDGHSKNCIHVGCKAGLKCMGTKCRACPRDTMDIPGEAVAVGALNVSSMANNMAIIAIGCTMFAGGYYMAMRKKNSVPASYGSM